MAMQEGRSSLGENSNHIVTVTPFNTNLKVHIRQFYVNENGEIASRTGVTLSFEEFNELVKPSCSILATARCSTLRILFKQGLHPKTIRIYTFYV